MLVAASFRPRLLLGTTVSETHQRHWKDLGVQEAQRDGGTFEVPYIKLRGETTMNGLDLIMALSTQALAVLGDLREVSGESPWLFPRIRAPKKRRSNDGREPSPVLSLLSNANKKLVETASLPSDLTGHDNRRTLISLMPLQGVRDRTISRVVGHSLAGITEDNVVEMADRRSRAGSPKTA